MHYIPRNPKAVAFGPLSLAVVLALAGCAQAAPFPCEPSAEVKQALRNLPEEFSERASALQPLLDRFPGDLFVHRAYQETMRNIAGYRGSRKLEELIARYRDLAEKHPANPLYAYLATRTLMGTQTREAIAQLEKHLGRWPDFAWSHLSLVEIYQAPAFRDRDKARQHLEAFMKGCPSSLEAFRFIRSMESSDFVRQASEKLLALIQNATEPEAVRAYTTLWALEFRVRPVSEHEALRQQVAEDLKRLRAADPGDSRDYVLTVREGYQLVGDAENEEWAVNLLKTKFSWARSTAHAAYDEWSKKNPAPKPDDPPEKRKEYNEALLKTTEGWVRQWPDDFFIRHRRFSSVRSLENVPAAVLEDAAEGLLKLKDNDTIMYGVPLELEVAQLYVDKSVRLDRAAELLAESFEELKKPPSNPLRSDFYPSQGVPDWETSILSSIFTGWMMAADVALKLKDKEKAREAIQQMDALMQKLKPSGPGDGKDADEAQRQRSYPWRQAIQLERMGGLAELEGRKMDALGFYQTALFLRPQPPGDRPQTDKDKLGEKARALWKELGGTNEGWQALLSRSDVRTASAGPPSPAAPTDRWRKIDKPLPSFELADMRGQKWTPAQFKGKVAFIGLWATW
jgi:hypothetical protein